MLGYYKDPEKTKDLIDENGWYHSGDVGAFLEDGRYDTVNRLKSKYSEFSGDDCINFVALRLSIEQRTYSSFNKVNILHLRN